MLTSTSRCLYDAQGRIIRLTPEALRGVSASYDASGVPRFGARRLHYSERVTTADPGSRLASAITDGGRGVGISFPLLGSWGSTDWAGAYPYIIWTLDDVFGVPLSGPIATAFTLTVLCRPTLPISTNDFRIVLAVVSETDLATGTVDGAGCGISGTTAGGLFSAAHRVINGTISSSNSAANASIAGASTHVAILGAAGTALTHANSESLDSAGVRVNSSANTAGAATFPASTRLYLALTAGRTDAANAAAVTLSMDAYVSPVLRSQLVT